MGRQKKEPELSTAGGLQGMRSRAAYKSSLEERMKFDGLGADPAPRDRRAYDRSKADPYDEAWGGDCD